MNFFCKLLIWMFCTCFVVFRTLASERRHPIMFQYIPVVVVVVLFTSFAHARWKPEYGNMPPEIRAWYAQKVRRTYSCDVPTVASRMLRRSISRLKFLPR
jgi:hypothetical protein